MDQDAVALLATQANESAKSAHKRLDNYDKRLSDFGNELKDIHDLTAAMSAVNQKVNTLSADVGEIKKEVKKVSERPAQWWDKLVAAAIGAVASGLVGAILAMILK